MGVTFYVVSLVASHNFHLIIGYTIALILILRIFTYVFSPTYSYLLVCASATCGTLRKAILVELTSHEQHYEKS